MSNNKWHTHYLSMSEASKDFTIYFKAICQRAGELAEEKYSHDYVMLGLFRAYASLNRIMTEKEIRDAGENLRLDIDSRFAGTEYEKIGSGATMAAMANTIRRVAEVMEADARRAIEDSESDHIPKSELN